MNKEQAIEIIETHSENISSSSLVGRALDIAIDALKAQLSQEGTTKDTTSELISRQQALNALIYAVKNVGILDADDIRTVFKALPTIQPEPCGDKSYALWKESYEELKRRMDELTACSDTISRQAAIDAIDVLCQEHRYRIPGKRETYSEYNEAWQDALDRAEGLIFNLPTIQPEPQWIPVSERLPSKEERKEWIDNNLDGIGYLYPCLVTRYSSINPDRTKNNPYVAKHYFDGEDFLNAGEEVCSEYIIAWMPLPTPYTK